MEKIPALKLCTAGGHGEQQVGGVPPPHPALRLLGDLALLAVLPFVVEGLLIMKRRVRSGPSWLLKNIMTG